MLENVVSAVNLSTPENSAIQKLSILLLLLTTQCCALLLTLFKAFLQRIILSVKSACSGG